MTPWGSESLENAVMCSESNRKIYFKLFQETERMMAETKLANSRF